MHTEISTGPSKGSSRFFHSSSSSIRRRVSACKLAGSVATATFLVLTTLTSSAHAQGIAVGRDLAAAIAPLNKVTVPDVNRLGILDGRAAGNWPVITNRGQVTALQVLGKALFWDMQVGGDGVQACASCHYNAGSDNRHTNQIDPGLNRTRGGVDPALPTHFNPDTVFDLFNNRNQQLTTTEFSSVNQNGAEIGLPVSELALQANAWQPDAVDGTPGTAGGRAASSLDVNDIVGSQGIRAGSNSSLSYNDVEEKYNRADNFTAGSSPLGQTAGRNSPTIHNAIYNLRSFHDGRADSFFNGVNPLGFRDPDSRVKVYVNGLSEERLRIPFSSLASQAVGPIESTREMIFTGRPHRDLGKKLLHAGTIPLVGQPVDPQDSLFGPNPLFGPTRATLTSGLGLNTTYAALIKAIFVEKFWGNGSGADVCLDGNGVIDVNSNYPCALDGYTLMEWNFSMFFGLAVQSYEALLTTDKTIVDLLVGGIATGTVQNFNRTRTTGPIPVTDLPLEGCITSAALGNSAAAQTVATSLCTQHYAQFIHPAAVAGSEAGNTGFPGLLPGESIGSCTTVPSNLATVARNGVVITAPCNAAILPDAQSALQAIDRGMGRFFSGATGCGICHFNPEFTGETVSALTGFGAPPLPPLPPGQVRKIPLEVPLERMIAFNGAAAVYDAGFYNIGVRPTSEDLAIGDHVGGVPLAYTKLAELINLRLAGTALPNPYSDSKIDKIAAELTVQSNGLNGLWIPTAANNLSPRSFTLALACGPGLVGNGVGANNNPNAQCAPSVIPGERLLRNGAFKAQGLRNAKFTGPYMRNGSKMNLRQVVEFYKTAGHMPNLNLNNLDAGMRTFDLGATDEASLVELMETGLTDWRVAHEQGVFDHPEICIPNGHDSLGDPVMVGIPAVGRNGSTEPLATFEEILNNNTSHSHSLADPCSIADL